MKTLIVSDIHANLAALKTVLEQVNYDRLICLGDIVAYGPQPRECLECLLRGNTTIILGNHDLNIIKLKKRNIIQDEYSRQGQLWDIWTSRQLSDQQISILESNQEYLELNEAGQKMVLVHNIRNNTYIYENSYEFFFTELTARHPADMVFFGHSHQPFIRRCGKSLFINTGSVGQSRSGRTEATGALIEDGNVQILRIPYNPASTIEALYSLPLHPEYLKLWEEFYRKGIVDQDRNEIIEEKILAQTNKLQKETQLC